tara:strand:+ start:164 stop:586 length:423 start_codon:yes stop_codon:yes gene_type:complete
LIPSPFVSPLPFPSLHAGTYGRWFPIATIVDTRLALLQLPLVEDDGPSLASIRTELSAGELEQVSQCPLPALRFRTAPGEMLDPVEFTLEPGHRTIYVVPGAANVELVHGVVPVSVERSRGAAPICKKLVRIAMITWIFG